MRVKDPALVTLTKDLSGSQRPPKPETEKNAESFTQDEVLLYTRVSERRFDGTNVKVYELSDGRGWVHETVSRTNKDRDKGKDTDKDKDKDEDKDPSSKRGLEVHSLILLIKL